jgi:16S rRNA G966 N2-methylase RsmD
MIMRPTTLLAGDEPDLMDGLNGQTAAVGAADVHPTAQKASPSSMNRGSVKIQSDANRADMPEVSSLYSRPLPAKRTGPLYSACSYSTKISPESIAVFIASHTKPGDTILDVFAGSGTAGLAAHLCARPTPEVLALAHHLKAPVRWGPRNAVLQEISVWGAFIAQAMCNPPDPQAFLIEATQLLRAAEELCPSLYSVVDPDGKTGRLRYAIWSDVLACPFCRHEMTFWDASVRRAPLSLASIYQCPACHQEVQTDQAERVVETYDDQLLRTKAERRKRVLKRIYGRTNHHTWSRDATAADEAMLRALDDIPLPSTVPIARIPWGDLYRAGYHRGITHAHHFYTPRNLLAMATLWEQVDRAPEQMHDALKLLILSYNATHSTLMTRVVVKQGQGDFVATGAQSGVLYVSGLPVEKNIFEGVRRKARTMAEAFDVVQGSTSTVRVVSGSSTRLDLPDQSVDYIFTDPPFGGFIPYAEVSFLNEVWLGKTTDSTEEVIVSAAQGKTVVSYEALMRAVFKEASRVLKHEGRVTIVFHSAKASVWQALQSAYSSAGLHVAFSGVLDKLQASFKQSNSEVSVKGDPLLLLTKKPPLETLHGEQLEPRAVIAELWRHGRRVKDAKERTPERLYSRFVTRYLDNGLPVPLDAGDFYRHIDALRGESR